MALAERTAIATSIVDQRGEPLRAMLDDLRLRTGGLENRARAKAMMEEILTETARHDRIDGVRPRNLLVALPITNAALVPAGL